MRSPTRAGVAVSVVAFAAVTVLVMPSLAQATLLEARSPATPIPYDRPSEKPGHKPSPSPSATPAATPTAPTPTAAPPTAAPTAKPTTVPPPARTPPPSVTPQPSINPPPSTSAGASTSSLPTPDVTSGSWSPGDSPATTTSAPAPGDTVAGPSESPIAAVAPTSGSRDGALPGALLALLGVGAVVGGGSAIALRGGKLPLRRGAAAPIAAAPPPIDPEAWARLVAEVEALPDNDPEPPATLQA